MTRFKCSTKFCWCYRY